MFKKVYDAEGKEYEVDAVDAKEYIATGRYTTSPPHKEPLYVHLKDEDEPAKAPAAAQEAKKA